MVTRHGDGAGFGGVGGGSVSWAPWGFCIHLSKKSSKSKDKNEAATVPNYTGLVWQSLY